MDKKTDYKNVRIASKSSIEITFYYPSKTTRQRERIRLKPIPANIKRAVLHLGNINEAIKNGTFDYPTTFPESPRAKQYQNKQLLAAYMRHWLEEHKYDYDDTTYVTYRRIINNQLLWLGEMRMEAITWGDITKWVRQQKVAQKTANNKLSPIRMAFFHAIDMGDIGNNPFANRKSPKVKRYQRISVDKIEDEIDPFSKDEIAAILCACKFVQHKHLIQFGFATGCRISEIIGMSWQQVDLINRTVLIDRKRTTHSKQAGKPKTRASKRTIKLNTMAWEAIHAQKHYTYLEGKEVFLNPRTNRPYLGDGQIRDRMWSTVLKRAGVRYSGPYQMRHTWASTALQVGESPYFVASNLGHIDPSFTMRVYNRYIPDNHPDAGKKFDEFFGKEGSKNAGKKLAN